MNKTKNKACVTPSRMSDAYEREQYVFFFFFVLCMTHVSVFFNAVLDRTMPSSTP